MFKAIFFFAAARFGIIKRTHIIEDCCARNCRDRPPGSLEDENLRLAIWLHHCCLWVDPVVCLGPGTHALHASGLGAPLGLALASVCTSCGRNLVGWNFVTQAARHRAHGRTAVQAKAMAVAGAIFARRYHPVAHRSRGSRAVDPRFNVGDLTLRCRSLSTWLSLAAVFPAETPSSARTGDASCFLFRQSSGCGPDRSSNENAY